MKIFKTYRKMQTAKEALKESAKTLKDLFNESFNISDDISTISFEIETKELETFQNGLKKHREKRPTAKIDLNYVLETNTLNITAKPIELFYFGFYLEHSIVSSIK